MASPTDRLPGAYVPAPIPDRVRPFDVHWRLNGSNELVDVLRALWRRKWLVLLCGVTTAAIGVAVVSQIPARYSAVAQIRVGVPQAHLAKMEPLLPGGTFDQQAVLTEAYVLQSREISGRVAERLALDGDPEFNPELRPRKSLLSWLNIARYFPRPPRDQRKSMAEDSGPAADEDADDLDMQDTVNALLSRLEVVPLGRSQVVSLEFASEDPMKAARIANALAGTYIEDKLVHKAKLTERTNAWLAGQIDKLRRELNAAERAVEEYRRDHGLYDVRAATVTGQQLSELNSQLIIAHAQQVEAEARLRQAETLSRSPNARDTTPEVLRSPLIQSLKEKEAEIQGRAAELSSRYGEKHPKMGNVKAELRDIRQKINGEIAKIIEGLRNEAQTTHARYAALSSSLESIKGKMGASNEATIRLRELERNADAGRALFESFLQRSKETNAQLDMQQDEARVISRASVPNSPSYPPVNVVVFIALIGGLTLGAMIVLLIDRFDHSFRSVDDVGYSIGLPTLALIPQVKSRECAAKRFLDRDSSPYVEAIRKLLYTVVDALPRTSARIVMVSSAVPNEGKTVVCLSLARLAAASGAKVIMLDADWRRPQLHTLVRRPNRVGLAELLRGSARPADAVYRDASGAHLVFGGGVERRYGWDLNSVPIEGLLESLGRHYDFVLVDTPPVLAGADVLRLAQCVDMTLFMVRWGSTPQEIAQRAIQELTSKSNNVAGVVLTQVDAKRYRQYGHGSLDYDYASVKGRRTG